jgi:hypothetical protein
MKEILSKMPPALPGNHQLVPSAHWLEIGPHRLLDTHFRLLREDMLRSFRDSMQTLVRVLRNNPDLGYGIYRILPELRNPNIAVYAGAQIEDIVMEKFDGILFSVSFIEPPTQSRLRRALIPGTLVSLVTFAEDGQCKMHFGAVRLGKKKSDEEQTGNPPNISLEK